MLNNKEFQVHLPPLILASGSPRRAEILTAVGWEFIKDVPEIDETERAGEAPADYVRRLAAEKASAIAAKYPERLVLGADTTVVVNETILGKPADLDDAKRMLRMLSGVTHAVMTGVALAHRGAVETAVQTTRVTFADMTADEIDFLAENGDPLDKAGAYAVQAQAALFIESIEGDYWNVVGLPVNVVYRTAEKMLRGERTLR